VLIGLLALVGWWGRLDAVRLAPILLAPLALAGFAMTAQSPGAVVEPMTVIVLGVVAGLSAACLPRDLRRRDALPIVLASVAAVVSLYAIYQAAVGLEALIERVEAGPAIPDQQTIVERARAGRAFALFPTPAALGGYLVLVLPLTATLALARRGWARRLLLGSAALQIGGLLAASSATALGAIVLASGIVLLRRVRTGRARALGAAAAATLVVALAAVALLRGGEVTTLDDPNSAWRLRAGNFRIAAEMIADRPWVGAGPGGYGEIYPAYRRPGDNESRHVHDLPLELAAELGLPLGLLAAGAFYVLFLGPLLRRRREGPGWWHGVEIGLAAFALQNLADFTAFLPSLLWTAALLRGWIVPREAVETSATGRWPALAGWSVALAAVILAVAAGLAANARATARGLAVAGEPVAAERAARRAVRFAPWDVDGRLLQVQAELATARPEAEVNLARVLAELDRAVALSPVRPIARDLRARVRGALGDAPGAYADALRAASLYPMQSAYAEHRDRLRDAITVQPEPAP